MANDEHDEISPEMIRETFYSLYNKIAELEEKNKELGEQIGICVTENIGLKEQLSRQSLRVKALENEVTSMEVQLKGMEEEMSEHDSRIRNADYKASRSSGRPGATDMPDMNVERSM